MKYVLVFLDRPYQKLVSPWLPLLPLTPELLPVRRGKKRC